MAEKSVAIIFNPVGGSAKDGTVSQLAQALVSAGMSVIEMTTTADPGSATYLASQARERGVSLIIAVGGDGTADGVAEGIIGSDTPMAIFPGGTGNLFASHFYGHPSVLQFTEMLLQGEPQEIDLMQVDYVNLLNEKKRRYLLVGIGFGEMSDAISNADPKLKRIFGQMAYFFGVTKASLNPGTRRYRITSSGQTSDHLGTALFVLNVPPKQMPLIAKGCSPSDGMLDVVLLRSRNFFRLLSMSARYITGKHESSPDYLKFRRSNLVIELDTPAIPNLDGDPGEATSRLDITVCKAAVKIILAA